MSLRIAMYHALLPQEGRKPGGVQVFVHRLANALTDRGHDVTVVAYQEPGWTARYRTEIIRPARAATSTAVRHYLATWLFNARPFGDRFDVVHMHGDDWFWFRRQVPTVRTYYGSALLESLTATSARRRFNQALVFGLELASRGRADAVYAIGSDSRAIYQADGMLRIGFEGATLPRAPSPQPSVLFIGTWEGRKRGRLLHDVFQDHIRPAFPEAELWLVSDRADAGPNATWHPSPDHAALADLLRRAWILCLPSRYEGFGMPYMEAMAAGLPVVASPNPGSLELLSGGAGLVVEDHRLAETLVDLLGDAPRREELAAAGLRRVEDFGWERILDDYEAAYVLAIERWRSRRAPR